MSGMVDSSGASHVADLLRVAMDAAVSAAIANKAPRRTVAATAASIASAFLTAHCGNSTRGGNVAPDVAPSKRRRKKPKKKPNQSDVAADNDVSPNQIEEAASAPVPVSIATPVLGPTASPVVQPSLDQHHSAQLGRDPAPLPTNSAESTPRSKISGASSAYSALGLTPSRTQGSATSRPVPMSPCSTVSDNSARPPGNAVIPPLPGGRASKGKRRGGR